MDITNIKFLHENGKLWTPIRTKPRREKKLAEYCAANNITYYLPLRRSVKRYERKTVEFWVPMFSGYIFCQINTEIYALLVKSKAVFFKVEINEILEKRFIEDLTNIALIEKHSQQEELEIKPELKVGETVIITAGPLKGLTGIVEKRNKAILITVNVELLGQSVSVEVDIGDLEKED